MRTRGTIFVPKFSFLIFIDMRNEKQYHFIYKTTNILSGRYYIGMHSTDNLDDGYLGSGTYLKRSLNKHGKENHQLEILEFCKTREELKSRETEIVNLNEIAKVECMNLMVGGHGGNNRTHEQCVAHGRLGGIAFANKMKLNPTFRKEIQKRASNCIKKAKLNGNYKPWGTVDYWTGNFHTEETKLKMKKSKNIGINNPSYGTQWITNDTINKRINKSDIIPDGFHLGRKY